MRSECRVLERYFGSSSRLNARDKQLSCSALLRLSRSIIATEGVFGASYPDLTLSAPVAASSTNAVHYYFPGHEIGRIVT